MMTKKSDSARMRPATTDLPAGGSRRRRVLFVGSADVELPLPASLARKWDAISVEFDVRVIGRVHDVMRGSDPRYRLMPKAPPPLSSPVYYAALPAIVGSELRRFRPDAVVTQSPYEAFAVLPALRLVRPRPRLLVELHGDWRTAPRLYGSSFRRPFAGLTDRAASFALRRAHGVRAVSDFTASLALQATGRPPLSVFPTYFDLESFTREAPKPLPDRPSIAWIGVLQAYKNPRMLADAWRIVDKRTSMARLVVLGRGPLQPVIDELVREFPTRVKSISWLDPPEVAKLLDDSTLLAMSSESEGLPRVVMEAFVRGRPVVATAAGGIPDIVKTGRNGMLVTRGNAQELADALIRVLDDPAFAAQLSRGALEDAKNWQWTLDRYGQELRRFVDSALNA